MFYSVVFIHTVRILYFAGCLVRNKATLVMHLGMIFFSLIDFVLREKLRIDRKNGYLGISSATRVGPAPVIFVHVHGPMTADGSASWPSLGILVHRMNCGGKNRVIYATR